MNVPRAYLCREKEKVTQQHGLSYERRGGQAPQGRSPQTCLMIQCSSKVSWGWVEGWRGGVCGFFSLEQKEKKPYPCSGRGSVLIGVGRGY